MLRLALACLFTLAAGGAYLSLAAGPAPQRVHGRVRLAIDFAFQDGVGEIRRVRDHFPRTGEAHP